MMEIVGTYFPYRVLHLLLGTTSMSYAFRPVAANRMQRYVNVCFSSSLSS